MDSTKTQIDQARSLLTASVRKAASPWPALGAALLSAAAAVLMAGMVILGPGVSIDEPSPAAFVTR